VPGAGEQKLAAINTIEIAEAERWNSLVLTLPNCDLRQGFEWGEIRRGSGWTPYRFAVLRGDRCIAAVQLLAKKVRRLGEFVLYAPRGPLLDWRDGGAWRGLLEVVNRVAAQTDAVLMRASPGVEAADGGVPAALLRHGFVHLADDRTRWNMPRIIQTLDLRPTEEQLRSQMRKRMRQSLDLALRRGAVIEAYNSVEAVRRLSRLMARREEQKGYKGPSLDWLLREHREYYASPAKGAIWIVSHQGRDLAAASAVRFGRTAHSLHLALDRSAAARSFRPGPALDWEAIRWAKAQGCEVLNLGGSVRRFPPERKDPSYGVYEYKRGLRASLNYLTGYYDLVFRPMHYRAFRLAEYAQPLWDRLHERFGRGGMGGHRVDDVDLPAPSPLRSMLNVRSWLAQPAELARPADRNGHDGLNKDADF